ncbi:MAG: pantoate--beta-alanine ligase [Bacteroidales bacterium]|nr:pantoate--beta-alanine ligase [Bacteroidales bacterium]
MEKLKIFNTVKDTSEFLTKQSSDGRTIGFVPTMGALHEGHLELMRRAKLENDILVCSIFVNPIQFNNKEDLKKYPRTLEDDIRKLESIACDVLFAPSAQEMYPEKEKTVYDFGNLDKVMEGQHRPGHFNGVAIVVKKLFDIIQPDKAYFGEKDFQQLVIIQTLVKQQNLSVEIVPCPIVREKDGLAMSSRNKRLSPEERKLAPIIFKTLQFVKNNFHKFSIEEINKHVVSEINSNPGMKLEYFEIVDKKTLSPITNLIGSKDSIACIALFLGKVRLIDNIAIF